MPITEIPLDSSAREEDVTVLHGKNLLLKIIENKDVKQFFSDEHVRRFLSTDDLCCKPFRETMNRIIELEESIGRGLTPYEYVSRRMVVPGLSYGDVFMLYDTWLRIRYRPSNHTPKLA